MQTPQAAHDPEHPVLSGEVSEIPIRRTPVGGTHPVLADLGKVWSLEEYAVARPPLPVGQAQAGWNAPGLVSVLDCCIRTPGGPVLLPRELCQVAPLVQKALGVALAHDPTFAEAYVYLTTDQRYVESGQTHRLGGFHVDGLQGARYVERLPVCYAFVVADRDPTVFAVQPFSLAHLDLSQDNAFRAMDAQARPEMCIRAVEGQMTLMSAYCVHASPAVEASGTRSFVRIEVTHKKFDRLGNTPNLPLSGDWAWVPRPIPDRLH